MGSEVDLAGMSETVGNSMLDSGAESMARVKGPNYFAGMWPDSSRPVHRAVEDLAPFSPC